jgi:hypothetical protein
LSIGADRGDQGRWSHEFDGFFAFSQQQSRSRRKPDIFQDRQFSTSPVNFTPVFKSMDQDIDLTIGSLNFHIGSLGSIRLSDPTKPIHRQASQRQ